MRRGIGWQNKYSVSPAKNQRDVTAPSDVFSRGVRVDFSLGERGAAPSEKSFRRENEGKRAAIKRIAYLYRSPRYIHSYPEYAMQQPSARVMGILNATDDSFYPDSRVQTSERLIEKASEMLEQGASILDLGGCSTRPGCQVVDTETETARVIPAIQAVARAFRASVAERALDAGATIVNDISGGDFDPDMFPLIARSKATYILMHTRGLPHRMAALAQYDDVTAQVYEHLSVRLERLRGMGVEDVVIDPGFGFAKDTPQNFRLLRTLERFKGLGCPVLVGMSRKGMIWKTLGCDPQNALNGTTVVNTLALVAGADILRVHDVRPAVEAIRLVEAWKEGGDASF